MSTPLDVQREKAFLEAAKECVVQIKARAHDAANNLWLRDETRALIAAFDALPPTDLPERPTVEALDGFRVRVTVPGCTPEMWADAAARAEKDWPDAIAGLASELSAEALRGYDQALFVAGLAQLYAQNDAVRGMGKSTPNEARRISATLDALDMVIAALEAAKEPA